MCAANACEVLVSVLATPLDNLLLNDPTNKKCVHRGTGECTLHRHVMNNVCQVAAYKG